MKEKRKSRDASITDGVQYRRTKVWRIALSQLTGAGLMCFYMLMTYATYIGNANFGVLVGVTGIIITIMMLFDGITDPIFAFIIERFHSKFGKIRIFLLGGWAVMSIATTIMCKWGAGHLSGAAGIAVFVLCYMLYVIGYTMMGIASGLIGPILTNDPKQRPQLSVWSTVYSYVTPTILSIIAMMYLMPKYDNVIAAGFLAEYNTIVVVLSLVFFLLACIAVSAVDKPENFENTAVSAQQANQRVSFREMWDVLRNNKELQRYIVAAASDKLASTVNSTSIISILLYGIMIGNISVSGTMTSIVIFPSIIFVIIGAVLAGKYGNKKVMVDWTWACLIVAVITSVFLLTTDTTKITVALLPTVVFYGLTFAKSAFGMVVSSATGSLRMDIVDYELYRSGRYMPATVTATYSFVDKVISSFGGSVAPLMVGLIGYTTVTPQVGDPLTMPLKIMTVVLAYGFPILGWICTIVAMRKSELSREKMIEVAKVNADRKAANMTSAADEA